MEKVAVIYNEPAPGKYHLIGEGGAIDGVLDAVRVVTQALAKLGYEFFTVPLRPPLSAAAAEIDRLSADIVFNLFEGFDGVSFSEAAVASWLEKRGFVFTGATSHTLRVCEDKDQAKQVLRARGIPTPDWQVLTPETVNEFRLTLPCIVKPLGENASHGLSEQSVVADMESLRQRVAYLFDSYGRASLAEAFLEGREFCALLVGNAHPEVMPIEEIVYILPPGKPRLLTYAAKWVPDDEYFTGTRVRCPAEIDARLKQTIEATALACFAALGCSGYARVDMRQDSQGQLMVLEVNANPDISSEGGARLQLEAAGISYDAFIGRVLSLARERSYRPGSPG